MSKNLIQAFNMVLKLQARDMTLDDLDNVKSVNIKAAPSNFFRSFAMLEESVTPGREFVLAKKDLDGTDIPVPVRGMRLVDLAGDFEESIITEVREMVILGSVAGYRCRTN